MEPGADANDDPLIGRTIGGRYRVRRMIGRGGMGAVYEAEHLGLDKLVAIKFLHRDADRDAVARFRREARTASSVSHEHVVHILDVDVDDDRGFLVMELVAGRDLQRVIDGDGPLDPARTIAIARQLLAGLDAIHAAGLVHRDIKPSNVMLVERADGSDFVKIMDFGVSKTVRAGDDTLTENGKVVGTPRFMAPEQLVGVDVDHRADLYATGLTVFAMLAGKVPFEATAFSQTVAAQLAEPAPSLDNVRPDLPRPLVAAVARALERHPNARFASARAFANALSGDAPAERTATGETAAARPSAKRVEAPRSSRGGARVAIAALAGVVVVGAIAAIVAWPRGERAASPADAAPIDRIALARAAEDRGELAFAIQAYREAYAAKPEPQVLYHLGDLYERIGERARAADAFERYLAAAPAATDRAAVTERLARLAPPPPPPPPPPSRDAGGEIDAPAAKPRPKPARGERGLAKPAGKSCWCEGVDADGSHGSVCSTKAATTSCVCRNKSRDELCPWPWSTKWGKDVIVVDSDHPGSYYGCIDPARADCRSSADVSAHNCHNPASPGKRENDPCEGYDMTNHAIPGRWRCDWCASYAFHGEDGDPCTGVWPHNGERVTGKLERCR